MPPIDLETLTRTRTYDGDDVVILRPGIALVMYSQAELAAVMTATADVLDAYFDFVPPGSIAALYVPPEDEYSPDAYDAFDAATRRTILDGLRAGPPSPDEENYAFELSGTPDGQAGDYGVSFGGTNLALADEDDNETSVLRLELPWHLPDTGDVSALVDFFERAASLFPFCSGNAGMSFIYAIAYPDVAVDEIQRLLPRFLGFDSIYGSPYLAMRGKAPSAHWLNLLDGGLVATLGGEERLRSELSGCEVRSIGGGMLVRAAKFPPVVDVNRQGRDIGLLPAVARALRPVRLDNGMFTPMPDTDTGETWLERFDALATGDWNNR
jgi:hypothetical protein